MLDGDASSAHRPETEATIHQSVDALTPDSSAIRVSSYERRHQDQDVSA
jgi:hypothetical protein